MKFFCFGGNLNGRTIFHYIVSYVRARVCLRTRTHTCHYFEKLHNLLCQKFHCNHKSEMHETQGTVAILHMTDDSILFAFIIC